MENQMCNPLITLATMSGNKKKKNWERIYLPQHLKEPLAMIAIRSPSSSASSIECVVSNIILPFFSFFINCHVKRIEYGSIPLVGSSRIMTCNKKYNE